MFECFEDFESFISGRLAQLRSQKDISARDMSLSIGQNSSYLNHIENKKSLPSMKGFYYICEFLKISPKDFFDVEIESPGAFADLMTECKGLDDEALQGLLTVVRNMKK